MMRKRWIVIVLILGLFALAASLSGCGAKTNTPSGSETPGGTAAETATAAASPEEKTFTAEELAPYNGKNGKPAYIAIDGKVYDVTHVPQWKDGNHAGKFEAGKDFSEALKTQAPHDAGKMQGVPIVGVLAD
jgi:predicted heme/steroid binding protein